MIDLDLDCVSIPLLALLQKRIDGDDALLRLASMRFRQAGIGAELYAETVEELEKLLEFNPSPRVVPVVHLPRWINMFEQDSQHLVREFAGRFRSRVFGMVVHDQREIADQFDDYVDILREIDKGLRDANGAMYLFVEYAAGLDPDLFMRVQRSATDLRCVSACLDVGHLGIWHAKKAFSRQHSDRDVCDLSPGDPALPGLIEDVQSAVESALDGTLRIIHEFHGQKKPVHFHLHDGHPLSTSSVSGLSDHLSFLGEVLLPFEYRGKGSVPLMYGPGGLSKIVAESIKAIGPERLSFSLEIHPVEGKLPLGDASSFFNHWSNKENAERMNYWLSVLLENHLLLSLACAQLPDRTTMEGDVRQHRKKTQRTWREVQ